MNSHVNLWMHVYDKNIQLSTFNPDPDPDPNPNLTLTLTLTLT